MPAQHVAKVAAVLVAASAAALSAAVPAEVCDLSTSAFVQVLAGPDTVHESTFLNQCPSNNSGCHVD